MHKEVFYEMESYIPEKKFLDEHEGYRLLWLKVIARAAYDWVLYRNSKNGYYKRLADSAHTWLFVTKQKKKEITIPPGTTVTVTYEAINSLRNVCEMLGLDVEDVRKFAKRLTRKDVRKLEFFSRMKKEDKVRMGII